MSKTSLYFWLLSSLLLLLNFKIAYADITAVKQSLNKKNIVSSEIELKKPLHSINSKINLINQTAKTKSKKLDEITQFPIKLFESLPIMPKLIKIKIDGNVKIIQIPYVNMQYIKNHKPLSTPKRIKDNKISVKTVPLRIGESVYSDSENGFIVPYPLSNFDFPVNEIDEKRKEGIKKISDLYDLINSLTTENYGNEIVKIYKLAYEEIFPNYSNYPDLCMITRLYLIESNYKISKQYLNSGSQIAKQYEQLKTDYKFYENYNDSYNKILNIIRARKNEMKENDKTILKSIDDNYSEIAKRKAIIDKSKEIVYPNSDEATIKSYVQGIAYDYNIILNYYDNIYMNYMSIGDYEKAHTIFDCKIENDKLIMSGKFFDEYKKIPYETTFKYNKYISGTGYAGTKEIMVKQIKNAESILRMTEIYRKFEAQNAQNFDKQDYNDNDNAFQKKIIKCCDFLNEPQFDTSGSPPSNAAEVIDPQKLAEFKKNAYGFSTQPGFENYFKNEPVLTKLYFVRVESTELSSNDIPHSSEQIILRAEIDYEKTKCPFYSFKVLVNSTVSIRNKTLVMKYDQNIGGYYGLFIPNETKDPKDEKINLINDEKNGKDLRISYFRGYENSKDCLYLYDSSYFKYKLVRSDYDSSLVSAQNNIIKNLFNFVKTGGAEYINVKHGDLSADALIKNQADWFIIDGDGPIENPIITSLDWVNVQPIRFFKEYEGHEEDIYNDKWLSKYKNPSFIDGLQVLILDACYSLKWPRHANQWHKVLPEGLIMGYGNKVSPWMTDTAFKNLKKKVDDLGDDKLTKKALGDMWLNLHDEISDYFLCYSAIYAVYILEKKMWYIEYEPSFFYEYKKVLKSMPIRY